jgi:hypothetical protein
MATQEEITQMQRLLEVHRRTLGMLLNQLGIHGIAYTPPSILHGIYEARQEIQRIKGILRGWGVACDDHPNDEDTSLFQQRQPIQEQSGTIARVPGIPYMDSKPDKNVREEKLKVYLAHDGRSSERVREVYQRLIKEGFSPWFDEEDLLPGQNWQMVTRSAIRNTDVVIIFLSKQSVSRSGYIHREITYALDHAEEQPEGTISIIPVRLDKVEIPSRLSHLVKPGKELDLFVEEGRTKEEAMQKLLQTLQFRKESLNQIALA